MNFQYNGVSIQVPNERPVFTHSVSLMIASLGKIEGNQNIPYFERLMQYKETELPQGELLHDVCALNSIRHLNYQVNNGGFEQYYYNGYHEYGAGYEIGDLPLLDINEQIKFLDKFILFILLDDDKKKYSDDLTRAVVLLRKMPSNILEYESLDDDEKEFIGICGADTFNAQWYKINEVIEWGIELYAQYLIKRLEMVNIGNTNK